MEKSMKTACEKSAVFLALLGGSVFVLSDPQALFDELCLRKFPWAELYRLETIQEANVLAFQRYGEWFYRTEQPQNDRPMALPVSGEFSLAPANLLDGHEPVPARINPTSLVEKGAYVIPLQQDFGGVWAFHALNGYGTQNDASNLLSLMLEPYWRYPCAQWYARPEEALYWSRHQYVARFYTYFDGQTTYPIMPGRPMEINTIFKDEFFANREKNRVESEMLNRLISFGMMI